MKIIVTCGPSYEPIDRVRRITNFSTGALGCLLANHFAQAGDEVWCLKGELAVAPDPVHAVRVIRFDTNQTLADALERIASPEKDLAVLHAAALCDFRVAGVGGRNGAPVSSGKIATRDGRIELLLEPTLKLLPLLRGWFPKARIAGWKYEVDGGRDEVIRKAADQIASARTDACVMNGPAWGAGFALRQADGSMFHVADRRGLAGVLEAWAKGST